MGIELITDATVEPISLELAWSHLRLDPEGDPLGTPDDLWLTTVGIPAAREACEDFLGVALAQKVYSVTLDRFPCAAIELAWPPLVEITTVTYVGQDGVEMTLPADSYTVDKSLPVPWLLPVIGSWPAAADVANAVRVNYLAGYTPANIPAKLKVAVLLMLEHMFKNRGAVTDKSSFEMPLGIEYLLRPRRVKKGMA
jgi:uncharacterized phiE125 gp8 family phage protein